MNISWTRYQPGSALYVRKSSSPSTGEGFPSGERHDARKIKFEIIMPESLSFLQSICSAAGQKTTQKFPCRDIFRLFFLSLFARFFRVAAPAEGESFHI